MGAVVGRRRHLENGGGRSVTCRTNVCNFDLEI